MPDDRPPRLHLHLPDQDAGLAELERELAEDPVSRYAIRQLTSLREEVGEARRELAEREHRLRRGRDSSEWTLTRWCISAYGATALGFALAGIALDDLSTILPLILPLLWAGALLAGAYVVSRGVAKGLKR